MSTPRLVFSSALVCLILLVLLCLVAFPREVYYIWRFTGPIIVDVELVDADSGLASEKNLEAIRIHLAERTRAILPDSSVGSITPLAEEGVRVALRNHNPYSEVWNLRITPIDENMVRVEIWPTT